MTNSFLLRLPFVILILFYSHLASAQSDSFAMPLDIPMQLSGTFAELRSNHFHSGIDIRTQEVEGLPVHVIEDGYVSRINISPYGFGKAVYVTHPSGLTSVYAHLSKLAEPLASAALEEQYRKESFSVDFLLPRNNIKVQKGQVIAWSGNSGGSSGPHLHFELRKTGSQHPVNPMNYGFTVPDNISPSILGIRMYPLPGRGLVQGSSNPYNVQWGATDTLNVTGEFYLGINTFDRQNDAPSKDGPFEITLLVDGAEYWQIRFDEFSYDETRYVNSLIDYATYNNYRQRYQLTRIQPNNDLALYTVKQKLGILRFDDMQAHRLSYVVKDFQGNESKAEWMVRNDPMKIEPYSEKGCSMILWTNRENVYEKDGIRISFPAHSLYEDSLCFKCRVSQENRSGIGPVYQVHTPTVPLHKYLTLQIQGTEVPKGLLSKTLIVRKDDDGSVNYLTTKVRGNALQARIREFGAYTLMIDTISPALTPINMEDGKDMTLETQIRFKIKDTQSGVVKYKMMIDGKWVLAEYEPKLDILFHDFDERMKPGMHVLYVEVIDDANNASYYSAQFTR